MSLSMQFGVIGIFPKLKMAAAARLGCYSNALRRQVASCTHASRKIFGLPHPTVIMWLSPLFFFPALFVTGIFFLKRSSGPLPRGYSGVSRIRIIQSVFWYSTDNRCRESRLYHEEPLFSFSFVCTMHKLGIEEHAYAHYTSGPPENRNPPESTGINRNQLESKSNVPKSYTKPPKSTAWKPQSTGIHRNQLESTAINRNQPESTGINH